MNKKKFMVLDVETTTIQAAFDYKKSCSYPLIYDLGYIIIDLSGYIYKKKNFLIDEVFNYQPLFNLAFYKNKRPLYLDKINNGEIQVKTIKEVYKEFESDLQEVEFMTAYNGGFDIRAIKFTKEYFKKKDNSEYIKKLNERIQKKEKIQKKKKIEKTIDEMTIEELEIFSEELTKRYFTMLYQNKLMFDMRFEIFDKKALNKKYKNFCIKNNLLSDSGKYASTTAETVYKFLNKDLDFIESHTAIDDSIIEKEIFLKAYKNKKFRFENTKINYPTHYFMPL